MVGSRGGVFTMARGRGDRGGVEGQASGAGEDCGIGWGGSAVPPGTQRPGPEWGEATGGTRSPGMRGSGSSNGRGRQTWFIVTRLAWAFRDARSWSCESCPAMADNRERLSQDDPESRCHIIGRDTLTGTRQKPGDSLWGEAVVLATRRCLFFFFFWGDQIRPSMDGVRFHFILTLPQSQADSACEREARR